jgi:hypothetical protein
MVSLKQGVAFFCHLGWPYSSSKIGKRLIKSLICSGKYLQFVSEKKMLKGIAVTLTQMLRLAGISILLEESQPSIG